MPSEPSWDQGWGPPPAPTEHLPELDGQPRRTSTLTVAMGGLSVVGGLLLMGVESAIPRASGAPSQPPWLLLLAVVFLIGRGGREVLTWWFLTYQVTSDRLVIDEGLLTRHHRVVPFERVQQVDVTQTLVAQILGLAALRLDTAGDAGATTVHLRLLDRRRAEGLRTYVLHRRATLQATRVAAASPHGDTGTASGPAAATGAPPPPARSLLGLDPFQLAVAGLSGPLGSIVAVLVLGGLGAAALVTVRGGVASGTGVLSLVVLMGGAIVVMSTLSTVLNLWDLRIELVGDDLRLRHGLFQVRSLTLPRRRVQHVSVVDSPLQRSLGIVSVTLHSAASGPVQAEGGQTTATATFTIPYVRRRELTGVLHDLLGGDWQVPVLTRRGAAAQRRAIVRRATLGVGIGLIGLAVGPEGLLIAVAGGALGALWGMDAHQRAGWAETPTLVVLAHGSLQRRVELVPVARVQSARTTSSPFQRRVAVATLHLDVAGRHAPHLYDLEAAVAEPLRAATPRRGATLGA